MDAFEKLVDEGPVSADKLLRDEEILVDDRKPDPTKNCSEPKSDKPKKPCANCTCGLADEQANNTVSDTPKTSCGSCYLGDAFRCASCPYRGTPAFKPGEKVTIDTTSDDL